MQMRLVPAVSAVLLLGLAGASAGASEATDVVTQVQTALIAVMKNAGRLGFQGRYQQLAPVVEETHDLPFVARATLGLHWKRLDADQQATMVATFSRLSIATYASRFDGYAGERFTVVSERPLRRGSLVLVESRFIKANGDTLQFNYLLHQTGGHWRIVNIIVDGVSDLALKRTEYGSLMEKEGFPALIAKLESQIRNHTKGS